MTYRLNMNETLNNIYIAYYAVRYGLKLSFENYYVVFKINEKMSIDP